MPKEKKVLNSMRVSTKAIRAGLLTGERIRPRGGRSEGAESFCVTHREEIAWNRRLRARSVVVKIRLPVILSCQVSETTRSGPSSKKPSRRSKRANECLFERKEALQLKKALSHFERREKRLETALRIQCCTCECA